MWECIDFFRMGDSKWMLMTSQITEGNDAYERHPQKLTEAYWIGDFDGRHFTPLQGHEVGRAVDFGYVAAAKTGADLRNSEASSRRVFFESTTVDRLDSDSTTVLIQSISSRLPPLNGQYTPIRLSNS